MTDALHVLGQRLNDGPALAFFILMLGLIVGPRLTERVRLPAMVGLVLLVNPKTLLVALIFTITVLGGKALAAVIAGRRFGFSWPEVGVMSGLSGSQAAATLATTLVGAKLGVFDKQTINAVLVVILASLVVTPAVVTFFARKMGHGEAAAEAIGSAVVVPVWSEATRPLLRMAGKLAEPDGGIVLATSLATDDASESEMEAQRGLKDRAEDWLSKDGLECKTFFRVARTIPAGLLETIRSEKASLLLAEWRSEARNRIETNEEALRMLSRSPVPVLIASGALETFERLIVVARREDLVAPGRVDLELAFDAVTRIGPHHPVLFVAASAIATPAPMASKKLHPQTIDSSDPLDWVKIYATPADLLVLPGIDAAQEALEQIPWLATGKFLVAIAAHGAPAAARSARSSGLVVGRSLTEAGAS